MKRILSTLLIIISVFGCAPSFKIIDKPVSFSEERIKLTKNYIKNHYQIDADDITINPKIIVLHWTAVDIFDSCYAIFNREKLGMSRPDLQSAGQVNVSIQFLVDQEGNVFRLMPETWMARHCIGINYNSIGVENVGGENNIDNLTDAQVESNIEIVRHFVEKYPTIEYLIGHHEYKEFEGHPLWLEIDDSYRTKKYDPGDRFMNAVRNAVADLRLKGVEEIKREIIYKKEAI